MKALPDYPTVIERPIDFGTIKCTLERGEYADMDAFSEDMRLVFTNALQYNEENTALVAELIELLDSLDAGLDAMAKDAAAPPLPLNDGEPLSSSAVSV